MKYKKPMKEWFITAPWGNMALISWGDPNGDPILLVHGRQDSVATFIPLLELLPDKYHYVGFDHPGHGKSDPFVSGVPLMRFHFVAAVDVVVNHLKWNDFVYIAHSMGSDTGLFYNSIYPGRIKKIIFLDPAPAFQRLQIYDFPTFYNYFYNRYYDKFTRKNSENENIKSKRQALDAVMRARGLTEDQAELILSRNMTCIGEDKYKLSWSRQLKTVVPFNLSKDYYLELFTKNVCPTLIISAENSQTLMAESITPEEIIPVLKNDPNFNIKIVKGGHDVHFTNPERIVRYVRTFLEYDFVRKEKSKL